MALNSNCLIVSNIIMPGLVFRFWLSCCWTDCPSCYHLSIKLFNNSIDTTPPFIEPVTSFAKYLYHLVKSGYTSHDAVTSRVLNQNSFFYM